MPKPIRLATLLAATLLAPIAAYADGNFERTLSVSAQPDLYVASGSGSIRVFPGSDGQIHVKAHLHGGSGNFGGSGDVDARINRIVANPPIQQSGNTIHVGDPSPADRSLYNNISIDYEITAPHGVALNLRTGSGDVEVDNLGRFLKAESGSGSVRAHNLSGPAELHTGSGDIELQEQAAGDVHARTGSGSIRAQGLNGAFEAHTGSGDIEAGGHLAGSGELQSGSGSIRLHLGHDAHFNLSATTGSGTIRVSQPGAPQQDRYNHNSLSGPVNGGGPSLEIRTGSGDIEIN